MTGLRHPYTPELRRFTRKTCWSAARLPHWSQVAHRRRDAAHQDATLGHLGARLTPEATARWSTFTSRCWWSRGTRGGGDAEPVGHLGIALREPRLGGHSDHS